MPDDRPPNIDKPPIHVKHSDLARSGEESMYRSCCPVCNGGVLLVYRHLETFELLERDTCISCGQAIIYDDIDELNRGDPHDK